MNTEMTIAEWIERVAERLAGAGLHFGHGTDNALDEAAWLVLHVLEQPLDGSFDGWDMKVDEQGAMAIENLAGLRCSSGKPLAYLTGTAYFAGLPFEVNESVLVPRSPFAELILEGFRPWLDSAKAKRVLDMCTGSGCIAIATAVHLSQLQVDAVDISREALQIAARNARRHGVAGRLEWIESDLFQSLPECRYDLIMANPPYVPEKALNRLPGEYRSEPGLGLVSGADGLDAALEILRDAGRFLAPEGVLICEVGESEERLQRLLPGIPFLWLEFEHGGSGVFVLTRQQLIEAGPAVAAALGKRRHVT
jgi:ribosomal protein L3 glutamine methyltransferase